MALFVYPPVSLSTSGLATEAKQDAIITELQDIEADIEAGNTAQATSANQTTMISELQNIEADVEANTTLLTSIDGKDFATETTLSALDGKVTTVDTSDVTVSSSALPTGAATSANQTTANASLSNLETDLGLLEDRLAGALVPEEFDYIALTYVAAGNGQGEVETATYRSGGASGTVVATLTLAYDASDRLSTVTRS